ncbi:MAG TPA: RNA polymerase sigma factor RpoD/SigA [Persephonella sp.]|uniref:RNA polymerase sigma factor n=1 Tax=Persephonella marina (strain DSM 14350 / EX-H1) TaxID=123214 RepID=C0QTF6_PERMH|nr:MULTISPECIES: RNA polymerase sigma factor RpoD/SigA [Persephonella]ACO04136.1 RNA polymerase sigma factor RpoD (Sigma-A) (Sigma-43) [Persephonella marina EX-H1]HCB70410.1 RNA polymerase sigma factor RpoD/SigA [Persephonella sp.]
MRKFKYEEGITYYLNSISKIPLLSPEEEKEIAKKAKEGDKEALEKLIKSNLRFVVNVAKNYTGYGIPFQELISAGNIGLIEAAKRFDPERGVRFISYAIWWIKQSILQTIQSQKDIIKIPQKTQNLSMKIDTAYLELKERLNREPKYSEIKEYLKEHENIDIDEETIENYLLIKRHSVSLDTPVDMDEGTFFIDLISKHSTKDIEENIVRESIEKEIEYILSHLSERERFIIVNRFGLNGEEPKTLREIGKELGISRERVRQIEIRALKKIRALATKKHLKDLLS